MIFSRYFWNRLLQAKPDIQKKALKHECTFKADFFLTKLVKIYAQKWQEAGAKPAQLDSHSRQKPRKQIDSQHSILFFLFFYSLEMAQKR